MDASLASNLTDALDAEYDDFKKSSTGFVCSNDLLPRNAVCMKNPEEMLKPWIQNPLFFNILITHSVTFLFGLLGNVLVIVVMVGDRKAHNATNQFLVSLAVADLLLLVVHAPLDTLQYFVTQWDEDGTVCKLAKYAELLSAIVSVLNLAAVTLERFIVIVFPMKSRSLCTMSNCRRAIFIVWLAALILSSPIIVTKGTTPMIFTNNVTNVTIYYCNDVSENGTQFAVYQFFVLFGGPGLLMVVCYTYVIRELWRSTRNMQMLTNNVGMKKVTDRRTGYRSWRGKRAQIMVPGSMPQSDAKDRACSQDQEESTVGKCDDISTTYVPGCAWKPERDRRKNKGDEARRARKQVIKMLILVIVLFLCCWGPRIIMEVIIKLGLVSFTQAIYNLRVTFNILPFIHACMNPFIYSFMSKNFRRSLQRQGERMGCVKKRTYCGSSTKTAHRSRSRSRDNTLRPYQQDVFRQKVTRGSTSSSTNFNTDLTKHTETEPAIMTTSVM